MRYLSIDMKTFLTIFAGTIGMDDNIDFESLNIVEPADNCGVCDKHVDDPMGYSGPLLIAQFFVDRFETALPNGDLHVTMCEDCYSDLNSLEIDPTCKNTEAVSDGRTVEQNWKAVQEVLEDVPPEALYWKNLLTMRDY